MNTGNNVRNSEKLLILTKKNDTIPTELYKVEILRKSKTMFCKKCFRFNALLCSRAKFLTLNELF